MPTSLRKLWILAPMMASLAIDCERSPTGAVPTAIIPAEIVLASIPADPPEDTELFIQCLNRMDGLQNHLRPSWRATQAEPGGEAVLFERISADGVVPVLWRARFFDVPSDFLNTMTVHDTNECARNPVGDGHVTTGVTVNGTEITAVTGNDALVFELNPDGTVKPPPDLPEPFPS